MERSLWINAWHVEEWGEAREGEAEVAVEAWVAVVVDLVAE